MVVGYAKPGSDLRNTGDIIHMIAQSNKQIKEQLASSIIHLQLHGSTPFKGTSASNYESEIVGSKFGISIGCVGIGIACRCENCAALDPRFYSS